MASFTATKLWWHADHEPDNGALVEAVALAHDLLTWRLRGFGRIAQCWRSWLPTGPTQAGQRISIRQPTATTVICLRAPSGCLALARPNGSCCHGCWRAAGCRPARLGSPYGGELVFGVGLATTPAQGSGSEHNRRMRSCRSARAGPAFVIEQSSGTVAGFVDARSAFLALVATTKCGAHPGRSRPPTRCRPRPARPADAEGSGQRGGVVDIVK